MKATKPTATKTKLFDAAQEAMLAKGYVATTVEEICEAAGVTKGSFFHYFKNKEELGRELLDRFVSVRQQRFQDAPFRKKRDPLQRVYGLVDFLIEMSQNPRERQSCLLGNFSQELSETHEELRQLCHQHFARWTEGLRSDLEEAKTRHAPRARFDTRSLAEHLIAVHQGALILAKSRQDADVIEESLKHFKRYLKSLYEK